MAIADKHLKRLAWAATLVLIVVIGIATLAPYIPDGSPITNDKVQHLIAFGSLTLPLSFAYPRLAWGVVLAAAAYGGLIELIQPHVGRAGEWGDLLADTTGAVLGAATAVLLSRLRRPSPA